MENLFRASKVKLTRARQFIGEVEAGLQAYDSSDPFSAKFSGPEAIEFSFKEIDPEVLSAFGDAIHNTRAALDLMAAELARINNESDKGVYFPFSNSKENFPGQIKEKKFYRAGEDAVALLKKFEPYSDGNRMLRTIHDLDIRDKHTNIIVTRRVTKDFSFTYRLDEGPNPAISVSGSNSHEFLDGALAGQPLVKTLKELVHLVDGIIEEFARMVESRKTSNAVNGEKPAT